jgi:GAF domain-containing protein
MELVTAFGYEPGMIEAFFPLSVNEPYPICVSVRQGRPVWLASLAATSDYPLLAAVWQKNESRALAALPLLREGAVTGAAGWTFREPQRFTDADQRTWLAIADFGAGIAEGGNSAQPATQAGA